MNIALRPEPGWVRGFLDTLAQTGNVSAAIRASGTSRGSAYDRRERHPAFAAEWTAALDEALARADVVVVAPPVVESVPAEPLPPPSRNWRKAFFEALAESSNVTAAAAKVRVEPNEVYRLRREDPAFAAKWLAALHEGYDNLEMELVGYLRSSDPRRKMDVAAALRLLAAHRETVERRRALTEDEDEQASIASLDAFFEGLKQRRLANEKILQLPAPEDDTE